MKILHLLDANAHVGGVSSHVQALTQGLRKIGHTPVVVGLTYPGPSARLSWADSHFPLTYGLWQGLRQRSAFIDLLKDIQPDLVHVHSGFTTVSPILLRALNRAWPSVGTLHDVRPFCFHASRRFVPSGALCQRRCSFACISSACYPVNTPLDLPKRLRSATINAWALQGWRHMRHSIVPSSYMRELALQHGFDAEKLTVIPHFTQIMPLTPAVEPPLILFLGRLDEKKGPFHLLEALALLKHHPWQAAFLGEGPAGEALQQRAQQLAISERVQFRGKVNAEEKHQALSESALLAFPSVIPESFGLSGIEAMAHGKPVVSFGLGGVREWLRHQENGLIAKDSDIKDLAQQIERLLTDPVYRKGLGEQGYAIASRNFQPANEMNALIKVYQRIVGSMETSV